MQFLWIKSYMLYHYPKRAVEVLWLEVPKKLPGNTVSLIV